MIPMFEYHPFSDFFGKDKAPPVSIESQQIMARWRNHTAIEVASRARTGLAKYLPRVRERDDRWIALATDAYSLSEDDLQHNVALGGDNTLLATLIAIFGRVTRGQEVHLNGLQGLTQLDIRHTLPGLQHDFCAVWNELVQKTRNEVYSDTTPIYFAVLLGIRHLYISLHQGTDAVPTAFSASTSSFDSILEQSSSYPLCSIPSHHPDSTPHAPAPDSPSVLRQVKEESTITGPSSPSDPITPAKIGDNTQALVPTEPTKPAHPSSQSADAPPPDVVAAVPQDTASVPMLSYTLRGTAQIAAADATSSSNPLLPASSVVNFFITAVPPPYHVQPLPGADSLSLLRRKIPSDPTGNATLTHPRARGLVNTGGMCFANAVLQLLVHSPPFWDLFRELDDLKDRRGEGPETPLTSATARFFDEFVYNEEPPPTQRQTLQAARGKPSEGEEETSENKTVESFDPTYMYDAMKEKKQLKDLLVRTRD